MAHVISVATSEQGYLSTLQESCRTHGYRFHLLGMGETWGGFGWRMEKAVRQACELPEQELVVMCDAYDVVMTGSSARLRGLLEACNKPFLIGCYRRLMVAGKLAELEFEIPAAKLPCQGSTYRLPCAGVWVTTAGAVRRHLLPQLPYPPDMDDQRHLCAMLQQQPELFYVDCGCHAVFHAFPGSLYSLVFSPQLAEADKLGPGPGRRTLRSGATSSLPCVLHGVGSTNMDPLLWRLGYPDTTYDYPATYLRMKAVYHCLTALTDQGLRDGAWCSACLAVPGR